MNKSVSSHSAPYYNFPALGSLCGASQPLKVKLSCPPRCEWCEPPWGYHPALVPAMSQSVSQNHNAAHGSCFSSPLSGSIGYPLSLEWRTANLASHPQLPKVRSGNGTAQPLKQSRAGHRLHTVVTIKLLFAVRTIQQLPFSKPMRTAHTTRNWKAFQFNTFHRFKFNWLDLNVDCKLHHNFLGLKFKTQASSIFIETLNTLRSWQNTQEAEGFKPVHELHRTA